MNVEVFEGGWVCRAGSEERQTRLRRNLCNYFAMGVQGYVGTGFERSRKKTRFRNAMTYFGQSLKWAIRGFPPLTRILVGAEHDGRRAFSCGSPNQVSSDQEPRTSESASTPILLTEPVELVVQNIPRMWYVHGMLYNTRRARLTNLPYIQGDEI